MRAADGQDVHRGTVTGCLCVCVRRSSAPSALPHDAHIRRCCCALLTLLVGSPVGRGVADTSLRRLCVFVLGWSRPVRARPRPTTSLAPIIFFPQLTLHAPFPPPPCPPPSRSLHCISARLRSCALRSSVFRPPLFCVAIVFVFEGEARPRWVVTPHACTHVPPLSPSPRCLLSLCPPFLLPCPDLAAVRPDRTYVFRCHSASLPPSVRLCTCACVCVNACVYACVCSPHAVLKPGKRKELSAKPQTDVTRRQMRRLVPRDRTRCVCVCVFGVCR